MTVYVSLLRGINLGSRNKIRMPELTTLYEKLGLRDVKTYLQSGNVVFESEKTDPSALADRIEAGIQQQFGFPIAVLNQAGDYFSRIASNNPFLQKRSEETSHLYVTFLYQPYGTSSLEALDAAQFAPDEFAPGEQAVYLFCPGGYGRTKLNNAFFERKLKVTATTRNWNTVQALGALANG